MKDDALAELRAVIAAKPANAIIMLPASLVVAMLAEIAEARRTGLEERGA